MQSIKKLKRDNKVDYSNSSGDESTTSSKLREENRQADDSDNDSCESDMSFSTGIDR